MLTRQNKAGLILAFVLGLTDMAILLAFLGDGDHPPVAIAVISVAIGILTLGTVITAWTKPTRNLMVTVIALRALSALGDLMGLGEDAAIVVASLVMFALSVGDLYLLRSWVRKPDRTSAPLQSA